MNKRSQREQRRSAARRSGNQSIAILISLLSPFSHVQIRIDSSPRPSSLQPLQPGEGRGGGETLDFGLWTLDFAPFRLFAPLCTTLHHFAVFLKKHPHEL